jgi:hypothetical protein
VVPHVSESDGPLLGARLATRAGVARRRGGSVGSSRDLRDQRLGVARTVPVTEHEWPDWGRQASRGPLSSTRGKRTWSISEIPAKASLTKRYSREGGGTGPWLERNRCSLWLP